jgi:hypothetical protein
MAWPPPTSTISAHYWPPVPPRLSACTKPWPPPLVLSLLGPKQTADSPTTPLLFSRRLTPSKAGRRLPSTSRSHVSAPRRWSLPSPIRLQSCHHRLTVTSMLRLFPPFFFGSSLLALPLRCSRTCRWPPSSTGVHRCLQAPPRRTGALPSRCPPHQWAPRDPTLPGISANRRRCSRSHPPAAGGRGCHHAAPRMRARGRVGALGYRWAKPSREASGWKPAQYYALIISFLNCFKF